KGGSMSHPTPSEPSEKASLYFDADAVRDRSVRADISVVEAHARTLWLASDEGAAIERLVATGPHVYAKHRSFSLRDFIKLPDDKGEADLEGLAVDGGYLWLVGSHAL